MLLADTNEVTFSKITEDYKKGLLTDEGYLDLLIQLLEKKLTQTTSSFRIQEIFEGLLLSKEILDEIAEKRIQLIVKRNKNISHKHWEEFLK